MHLRTAGLLGCLMLFGCGKEVGRVPFAGEGTGSSTMTLKAGDVAFWTDIDISYEGSAALAYTITLEQGGAQVATATCNPLDNLHVKVSWSEKNVGGSHARSGLGKMNCGASLSAGGPTTVKAKLAFAAKPASLSLSKADLVVKQ